jgi:glycosyltransferase involved in cell wall biosynthesis
MKIVAVHPSSELYGSDRSFAAAIRALAAHWPSAEFKILLPCEGPLQMHAPFDQLTPRTRALWILRRKDLVRSVTTGLLASLAALRAAWRDMTAADLIYVDTVVAFDFLVMARFVGKKPVVVHVREIPTGIELKLFRGLLIWSGANCIFNSNATRDAFALPARCRSTVVYNGFVDPGPTAPPDFDGARPLRLMVIGRINAWKGQEILVSAIGLLSREERYRVEVRIVGGVYGPQDIFLSDLQVRIDELGLADRVRIDPFEDDPSDSFRKADVVVVPSRKPEPFGRVAIEAMAFARPVLAAGHGGLVEIVVDGETGTLVAPNNAAALADAIRALLDDPGIVVRQGAAARHRFIAAFTMAACDRALGAAFDTILPPTGTTD